MPRGTGTPLPLSAGTCPTITGAFCNKSINAGSPPKRSSSANSMGSTTSPAPFSYNLIISLASMSRGHGHCPLRSISSLSILTTAMGTSLSNCIISCGTERWCVSSALRRITSTIQGSVHLILNTAARAISATNHFFIFFPRLGIYSCVTETEHPPTVAQLCVRLYVCAVLLYCVKSKSVPYVPDREIVAE